MEKCIQKAFIKETPKTAALNRVAKKLHNGEDPIPLCITFFNGEELYIMPLIMKRDGQYATEMVAAVINESLTFEKDSLIKLKLFPEVDPGLCKSYAFA